jgi:hypothetical protein
MSKLPKHVPTTGSTQAPAELLNTPTRGEGSVGITTSRVIEMLSQAKAGRPRAVLPDNLPQQTFQEAKVAGTAICDGISGRHWSNVVGEIALRHAIPDEPLQTKITASPALDWWDKPASYTALRDELQCFSPETALLFNLVIGLVIGKEHRHVTVELDELIRALGWQVRSVAERTEKRRAVYRWLLLLQSISVHGKRVGKYNDPLTKQEIDLCVSSEIVRVSEAYYSEQQLALDRSEPPVKVTISASAWLERLADDRKVLQSFGRVQKLAGLPTGKVSGAWALTIGLALNQLWRERSARAEIYTVGESKHLTANFGRPFTRAELFDLFQPAIRPEEILESDKPGRALKYWQAAIKHLKEHGVIGHYKELDPMPQERKGWGDFWLKAQRLDIRPKHEEIAAVAEIARGNTKAQKALRRRRKVG